MRDKWVALLSEQVQLVNVAMPMRMQKLTLMVDSIGNLFRKNWGNTLFVGNQLLLAADLLMSPRNPMIIIQFPCERR